MNRSAKVLPFSPPPREALDPHEKRVARLHCRTTDPIVDCLVSEMRARGLCTVSNMLHLLLLERYQKQALTGLPCRPDHPLLASLDEARTAAEAALVDGVVELHETPAIQGPIVQAERCLWEKDPEAA